MTWKTKEYVATIPMRMIGPVKIISKEVSDDILIPLATLESPLWLPPIEGRAYVRKQAGSMQHLSMNAMTRSVLIEADSTADIHQAYLDIQHQKEKIQSNWCLAPSGDVTLFYLRV